jgi:hypothetical protein
MYDTTWSSYYVGEPTVVRLGTKPRPKAELPPATDKGATGPTGPTKESSGAPSASASSSQR